LSDFSLAELKELQLGAWFNKERPDRARPEYVGAKIATLDEILERVEAEGWQHGIYIETKAPENFPGIEKELVEQLTKRGWITSDGKARQVKTRDGRKVAGVILQSFSLQSLQLLKAAAPEVPRVYLVDEEMEASAGGYEGLVAQGKQVAHALGPSGYMAWPWKTRLAHDAGLFVHHYTINTPFLLGLMKLFGSDGVFTDRTEMVRADLGLEVGDPAALITGILQRPPPELPSPGSAPESGSATRGDGGLPPDGGP
jgi:glycerophosphoryl diester phosphodiesterase